MDRYLITGASRGIGRAIAESLANKNSELLIHGRDKDSLDQTAILIQKKGSNATKIIADISNLEGVEHLIKETGTEPLKVLINNAGIAKTNPLTEITLEEWNRTFFVNVTAPFLLSKGLLPLLKKGSTIVNILSGASKKGYPTFSTYCMSKFAMEGFSQSIREELAPKGIRVINIYPGSVATDIWKGIAGDWDLDSMMTPQVIADAVKYVIDSPSNVQVNDLRLISTSGEQ